jgi:hypothetical protein
MAFPCSDLADTFPGLWCRGWISIFVVLGPFQVCGAVSLIPPTTPLVVATNTLSPNKYFLFLTILKIFSKITLSKFYFHRLHRLTR